MCQSCGVCHKCEDLFLCVLLMLFVVASHFFSGDKIRSSSSYQKGRRTRSGSCRCPGAVRKVCRAHGRTGPDDPRAEAATGPHPPTDIDSGQGVTLVHAHAHHGRTVVGRRGAVCCVYLHNTAVQRLAHVRTRGYDTI